MVINIRDIKEGSSVIEESVDFSEEQIKNGGFAGSFNCTARITKARDQIRIEVSYTGILEETCARCLTPFSYKASGISEIMLRHASSREDNNISDQDDGVYIYNDSTTSIDIRPCIYDDIMVNRPLMPLCTTTCEGIIPDNKKRKQTLSASDSTDPRWDALKKLKEKR